VHLNLIKWLFQEGLSKKERQARRAVEAAQDRAVREASINRGRMDSMASDGISWGMQEDAEEEGEVWMHIPQVICGN
jgi:hypothetical protein